MASVGAGDLPQLLRSVRSMMMPPPPTPTLVLTPAPALMDVTTPGTSGTQAASPVKEEGDEPVVILVGGLETGPAPSAIPLGGRRMVATPISGRPTQERFFCVPYAAFQPITWIRCRGT